MTPAMQAHFSERRRQPRAALAGKDIFRIDAMTLQDIKRHKKLPPCGVVGKEPQLFG